MLIKEAQDDQQLRQVEVGSKGHIILLVYVYTLRLYVITIIALHSVRLFFEFIDKTKTFIRMVSNQAIEMLSWYYNTTLFWDPTERIRKYKGDFKQKQ